MTRRPKMPPVSEDKDNDREPWHWAHPDTRTPDERLLFGMLPGIMLWTLVAMGVLGVLGFILR